MPDIPWSNTSVFVPQGWPSPDSTLVGLDGGANAQFTPQAGYKYIVSDWATTANLTTTYNNGTSGVGATLTATSNGAISIDGGSPSLSQLILVKDQSTTYQNGLYIVSQVGDGSNPFILTRYIGFDEAFEIPLGINIQIINGTSNADTIWIEASVVSTIGTDPITFTQRNLSSGGLQSIQVFTSNGTWTKPSGVNTIVVEAVGGGGGGGYAAPASSQSQAGSGGAAGGYASLLLDVSAISSETVTIGAAGAGGIGSTSTAATAGGTTSFGAHISCPGGGAGKVTNSGSGNYIIDGGSAGSTPTGGDINSAGSPGECGQRQVTSVYGAGNGGDSALGPGGKGGGTGTATNWNGSTPSGYGGGGGGAGATNAATRDGGNGAAGVILVWEYS